jgi:hypothetical protein
MRGMSQRGQKTTSTGLFGHQHFQALFGELQHVASGNFFEVTRTPSLVEKRLGRPIQPKDHKVAFARNPRRAIHEAMENVRLSSVKFAGDRPRRAGKGLAPDPTIVIGIGNVFYTLLLSRA